MVSKLFNFETRSWQERSQACSNDCKDMSLTLQSDKNSVVEFELR